MIIGFILITVETISSILLIGLILMQKSKSEGLGLAFGAGMGETLFGSRAGNVLTKLTIVFASVFLVNTVLLGIFYSGARGQSLMSRQLGAGGMAQQAQPVQAPAPAGSPMSTPVPPVGVPTLPGATLEDQPVAAPVATPVEQAPVVVEEPVPAPAPAVAPVAEPAAPVEAQPVAP